MKILKIVYIICFIFLLLSIWFTISTALFPLRSAIGDVITRDFFVKIETKIETKESMGKGNTSKLSYCLINNKKLVVQDAAEDELTIDNFYYVWYNTKTDKVYLTEKGSNSFDVYGRLGHLAFKEFVIICISVLLFFTMRYLRKIYKE